MDPKQIWLIFILKVNLDTDIYRRTHTHVYVKTGRREPSIRQGEKPQKKPTLLTVCLKLLVLGTGEQ